MSPEPAALSLKPVVPGLRMNAKNGRWLRPTTNRASAMMESVFNYIILMVFRIGTAFSAMSRLNGIEISAVVTWFNINPPQISSRENVNHGSTRIGKSRFSQRADFFYSRGSSCHVVERFFRCAVRSLWDTKIRLFK